MNLSLKDSQTKFNLMRAFTGESQARNRYTFAAQLAHQKKLPILEKVFLYTAEQEKAHAKVFYDFLKDCSGETITIDGSYPVDYSLEIADHLKQSHLHEYHEFEDVYPAFANIAEEEGFLPVAHAFRAIAQIEKSHGNRFEYYYQLLQNNTLFQDETSISFLCLNCGHIHNATNAPEHCPVCQQEQGYFIRLKEAPFSI